MYSKMAEEDDNKMAERWQKDADSVLIFVSSAVGFDVNARIDRETINWFILCSCCRVGCGVDPGPETKLAGHLCILPGEYISASC
jgi:hypothetical protein